MNELDPIPNWVFQGIYLTAVVLMGLFTLQAWRYAWRRNGWGPWATCFQFAMLTIVFADLFALRSFWAGDRTAWHGANGVVTAGIRFVWLLSLAIMLQAARKGAILRHQYPPGMVPRRRSTDWPQSGGDASGSQPG